MKETLSLVDLARVVARKGYEGAIQSIIDQKVTRTSKRRFTAPASKVALASTINISDCDDTDVQYVL